MKTKLMLIIIHLFLQSAFLSGQTGTLSAEEYMRGFHLFGDSNSYKTNFSMEIINDQGNKNREILLLMDKTEEQKILIQITSPVFLSNMKYLSKSEKGKEVRWMKTSRGVRRLSARNNDDALFGSDFTIEDLSLTSLSNYSWSFENTSDPEYVRVKAVPLYESPGYAYKIIFIDEDIQLISRIEYYNHQGLIIKKYELLDRMYVDSKLFPREISMTNLEKNSKTILLIQKLILNPALSSGAFNKGNL